jgi:AcrR family transcriptional regulator
MTRSPTPRKRKPTRQAEAARVARRERRRESSREEILDAARSILLTRGISGATLEAVAQAVGVSKAALYYYFPSKEALFFEVMFGAIQRQANAVHAAVEQADTGSAALAAVIRESVATFAPRMDDFRLAFLHGQVSTKGAVRLDAEQFARIRPLNDLVLGLATQKLMAERKRSAKPAAVDPRLMAFLAYLAAIGMLTMKGMVEHMDDPLIWSDEQLVAGFAQVFAAATKA